MNCRYCASELPDGALFCGECGRSTRAAAPPASADPEAQEDFAGPLEQCTHCGAELAAEDIFCGECGLVRQSVAARRGPDTIVLPAAELPPPLVVPPPPAPPSPVAVPEEPTRNSAPAAEDTESGAEGAEESDVDLTRIVDRAAKGERFVLQFSTGESLTVTGTGLVGRNPRAEPGEYFDHILPIVDPGKSVSKTHLEFGQEAGAFWISDRYSGNGTIVREPDRPTMRCDPGKRYRVVRGTRIDMGEQFFVVS